VFSLLISYFNNCGLKAVSSTPSTTKHRMLMRQRFLETLVSPQCQPVRIACPWILWATAKQRGFSIANTMGKPRSSEVCTHRGRLASGRSSRTCQLQQHCHSPDSEDTAMDFILPRTAQSASLSRSFSSHASGDGRTRPAQYRYIESRNDTRALIWR
jgi:hypothetical protein